MDREIKSCSGGWFWLKISSDVASKWLLELGFFTHMSDAWSGKPQNS